MNVLDRLRLALERNRQNRLIRRHGWTGVYIGDYHSAPSWAYTIGFDETLDHPEIIVFDLPIPTANGVFARIFDEVRSGELVVQDGQVWLEDEGRCAWRKVHPDHVDEWLTLACMRRFGRTGARRGLEAYQLVLSDPQKILPWEPGYDESLRKLQPALYEPSLAEVAAAR